MEAKEFRRFVMAVDDDDHNKVRAFLERGYRAPPALIFPLCRSVAMAQLLYDSRCMPQSFHPMEYCDTDVSEVLDFLIHKGVVQSFNLDCFEFM